MLVASREIYKVNRKRKENTLIMRLVKGKQKNIKSKDQSKWILEEAMIMMEGGKKMIKKSLKKNSEE